MLSFGVYSGFTKAPSWVNKGVVLDSQGITAKVFSIYRRKEEDLKSQTQSNRNVGQQALHGLQTSYSKHQSKLWPFQNNNEENPNGEGAIYSSGGKNCSLAHVVCDLHLKSMHINTLYIIYIHMYMYNIYIYIHIHIHLSLSLSLFLSFSLSLFLSLALSLSLFFSLSFSPPLSLPLFLCLSVCLARSTYIYI